MSPKVLEELLAFLPNQDPLGGGRFLVPFAGHEDAAIVRVPAGKALVQTVDILSPISQNPFVFGQIAAANAFSDIFAMGGEAWTAMNIACFPDTCGEKALPIEIMGEILRGGYQIIQEAGAVLAGGHTVLDDDLKYGLSVTGLIDPDHVATNASLMEGDRLYLTKPIGTGVLATVAKANFTGAEEAEKELCHWAIHLNNKAGACIRECGLKAATDITGFGLGGHSAEMAEASGKCVRLYASQVPLLQGVWDYAEGGLLPAGTYANARFFAPRLENRATDLQKLVLFDAQTSGGLLLAVPPAKKQQAEAFLTAQGELFWCVGEVLPARKDGIQLEILP